MWWRQQGPSHVEWRNVLFLSWRLFSFFGVVMTLKASGARLPLPTWSPAVASSRLCLQSVMNRGQRYNMIWLPSVAISTNGKWQVETDLDGWNGQHWCFYHAQRALILRRRYLWSSPIWQQQQHHVLTTTVATIAVTIWHGVVGNWYRIQRIESIMIMKQLKWWLLTNRLCSP